MVTPNENLHDGKSGGERIAKVIARSGLCSRREAEALIDDRRVSVNGAVIDSAALDILPTDKVLVDGKPLAAREPPRLWRYHKPKGRVTTHKDPEGRPTVFEALPENLPRLISVGRAISTPKRCCCSPTTAISPATWSFPPPAGRGATGCVLTGRSAKNS